MSKSFKAIHQMKDKDFKINLWLLKTFDIRFYMLLFCAMCLPKLINDFDKNIAPTH